MTKPPVAVLHHDLQAHPAVLAWTSMGAAQELPQRLEVLCRPTSSEVYRLIGAGPGGGNVIAKRSRAERISIELTIYERILPHLPVTAPRYYGSRPINGGVGGGGNGDSGGDRWIFLEDMGADQYSEANPEHLMLTARWAARMHRAAADLPAVRSLPDGGPGRYLAHLRSAREKIRLRLPGPDLTRDDVTMLENVIATLDRLEARWGLIDSLCEGLPVTLVHGDFRPKNVLVRGNGRGLACYPIDWETAGWGVPAADLTRIDVTTYRTCAGGSPDLATVQRLVLLGRAFCAIAGIDWDSVSFRFEGRRMISRELSSIAVLVGRLSDAARAVGVIS